MSDAPVTIASFESAPEAYFVKGFLENRGIQVFVAGEQMGTMLSGYTGAIAGISLVVSRMDAEAATSALEDLERMEHAGGVPGPPGSHGEQGVGSEEAPADEDDAATPSASVAEGDRTAIEGGDAAGTTGDRDLVARARSAFNLSVLSILIPIAAPFALARAFAGHGGVEASALAKRYRNRARWCALVSALILGVVIYGIIAQARTHARFPRLRGAPEPPPRTGFPW